MNKLEVGQEVIVVTTGNMARHGSTYRKAVIEKVGRKYFTVDGCQFHIDTMREKTIYSVDFVVYLNEQEYLDKVLSEKLFSKIKTSFFFGYQPNGISLDKLKKIADILEIEL